MKISVLRNVECIILELLLIKFVKLNETYIKIVCEQSILLEISKEFEYTQKNYQYTPQGRRGWDGTVKMINTRNGNFLSGLLKVVVLKCKELGYNEFTFEGFDNAKSEYTENAVLSALDAFKLKDDSGIGLEIREHQLNAILTCLLGMRRVIESPTSCLDPLEIIEVELDSDGVNYLNKIRLDKDSKMI